MLGGKYANWVEGGKEQKYKGS